MQVTLDPHDLEPVIELIVERVVARLERERRSTGRPGRIQRGRGGPTHRSGAASAPRRAPTWTDQGIADRQSVDPISAVRPPGLPDAQSRQLVYAARLTKQWTEPEMSHRDLPKEVRVIIGNTLPGVTLDQIHARPPPPGLVMRRLVRRKYFLHLNTKNRAPRLLPRVPQK